MRSQTFRHNGSLYSVLSGKDVELLQYNPEISTDTMFVWGQVKHRKKIYNVVSIAAEAFHGDWKDAYHSVKHISIADGIEYIASDALCGKFCNLLSITIPPSMKSIGNNAFANIPSLNEAVVRGGGKVSDWGFSLNPSLYRVVLDSCISEIGENAFFNCTRLTNIDLTGVDLIGEHAFECTGLESISLPKVGRIGDFAFSNCRNLEKVNFSNQSCYIGDFAFLNNTALKHLRLNSASIGECVFMGCSSLQTIVLADSVKHIGSAAFLGCTSLNELEMSASISRIESMTFMDCVNLEEVTIPQTVTFIGESAFEGTGIREIVIPPSVVKIEKHAFRNCENLTKIIISRSTVELGQDVADENVILEYK